MVAEFAAEMRRDRPRLDRAAALVAGCGRPEVDPELLLDRLDLLAGRVGAMAVTTATGVCSALFGDLGFTGNRTDYHDPRNSLLDQVLDRRTGIPLTLALVAVEVGRRLGVPLVGIGMPGHFLLRDGTDGDAFFDAFDGGRPLDRDACRVLFARLHGATVPFQVDFLDPTPSGAVVERMLNNLRAAHLRTGDRQGLIAVLRLQSALPGASPAVLRQLTGVLSAEGRFLEAAALHERLADEDDPARRDGHRRSAVRLRAHLN